jgi:hypothetical protein
LTKEVARVIRPFIARKRCQVATGRFFFEDCNWSIDYHCSEHLPFPIRTTTICVGQGNIKRIGQSVPPGPSLSISRTHTHTKKTCKIVPPCCSWSATMMDGAFATLLARRSRAAGIEMSCGTATSRLVRSLPQRCCYWLLLGLVHRCFSFLFLYFFLIILSRTLSYILIL